MDLANEIIFAAFEHQYSKPPESISWAKQAALLGLKNDGQERKNTAKPDEDWFFLVLFAVSQFILIKVSQL